MRWMILRRRSLAAEMKCASACCQKWKQQRPARESHQGGTGELGLDYRSFSKHILPHILSRHQLQSIVVQFSFFLSLNNMRGPRPDIRPWRNTNLSSLAWIKKFPQDLQNIYPAICISSRNNIGYIKRSLFSCGILLVIFQNLSQLATLDFVVMIAVQL